MRIGYFFHGFLGDVKLGVDGKELSTPDGNATYSWSIVNECIRRGYRVIPLGENLDAPAAERMGVKLFEAFSPKRRADAYEHLLAWWVKLSDRKFPELDLVLVEWRWPIPGRNTPADRGKPGFQGDLDRMNEILTHYNEVGTPVIVWDLDHKMGPADEGAWIFRKIFETSTSIPRRSMTNRVRVEPPFIMKDLLQFDIETKMPEWGLGYIGSRYERDEQIDQWIKPITPKNTHRAKFWGKWEPRDEVSARWPGVKFGDRIGVKDFRAAYSSCAAVPLLAKESYRRTGFMTPRVWEAVLFGTMPIGLSGHLGVDQYCELVARDPQHLFETAWGLRAMSPIRRRVYREDAAHRLMFMDAKNFIDILESYGGASATADEVGQDGKR